MSYRTGGGGGRPMSDYDDRSYHAAGRRRDMDDGPSFERRGAPSRVAVRDYEDTEISIRDRTPAFLRNEGRQTEAGPLVLRSREIETIDRRRPRSPSPVRMRERDFDRSPAPPMPVERRPRFIERERSPSPQPGSMIRVDHRHVERRRERSPTPEREREEEHIRIIRRERRASPTPSPSPSPPPAPKEPEPQVIRGPTIEREVITHYRDVDHGVVKAPSPPPPPRPMSRAATERETDIDIFTSRHETEVEVRRRSRSRSRPPARGQSRPREQSRPRPRPAQRPSYYDDEVLVQSDRDRLRIDVEHGTRRARSAAPARAEPKPDYADEAEYITGKIDARGQMGEAWNGATKEWTIIDVPPGTERVKMDGVGGGGAEVTWQRYNGVRRAKFVPEREGTVVSSASAPEPTREPVSDRDRLSVQIFNSHSDRDRDVVEDIHDTRISIRDRDRRSRKKEQEMWTEITKDLVVREAIERYGYEYEETEYFFYVMEYLKYEDVLELVNASDGIRRARRERAREIEWEREARDRWERRHRSHRSAHWDKYDNPPKYEDERVIEHEVIYDRHPVRGYLR